VEGIASSLNVFSWVAVYGQRRWWFFGRHSREKENAAGRTPVAFSVVGHGTYRQARANRRFFDGASRDETARAPFRMTILRSSYPLQSMDGSMWG
jgi:hypothetical protein